ncbi:MAG: type II toxin-antitoxin system PemK/MazF family toxin [Rhodohalobacter sp.]|uniref:type II toxin-antitoxin system PemK/MazF family toxin n=1 Tax=Rhodohalobacter sp. TaxID=1974210 RepID=UPI003974E6F3
MVSRSKIKYSIVLVPFPFDDFSDLKVRPALCLTSSVGKFEHVVISFISSVIPNKLEPSDVLVEQGSKSWEKTGLHVDSVLRLHKLVTIPKSLIKRKLGELDNELKENIKQKLDHLFELE